MAICYCGSNIEFDLCCKEIIAGNKLAKTAEEILRSRFSAHSMGDLTWIDKSTHPSLRDDADTEELKAWQEACKWQKLEILSIKKGTENDTEGEISFIAHYTINGMPQKIVEDAFFKKEDNNWYYVDGNVHKDEPAKRDPTKVGRNDLCSCGSGKKYKKCCGK